MKCVQNSLTLNLYLHFAENISRFNQLVFITHRFWYCYFFLLIIFLLVFCTVNETNRKKTKKKKKFLLIYHANYSFVYNIHVLCIIKLLFASKRIQNDDKTWNATIFSFTLRARIHSYSTIKFIRIAWIKYNQLANKIRFYW